jgi:hypothetical protein
MALAFSTDSANLPARRTVFLIQRRAQMRKLVGNFKDHFDPLLFLPLSAVVLASPGCIAAPAAA